ncbi:MAG: TonB-dependent receptor plug domain-containing protein [Ferruginibacter sp.]|nr:TonB-dependent receptor plug domain-containing protein [Ferruginibacter sp.]
MKKPFLLCVCTLLLQWGAAQILENNNPSTNIADTSQSLEQVVVQSFGYNAHPAKVPAAISYLSTSDLNKFNGNDFVAAVNTAPGVKMDERSPGSYRLSIRGNLLRSTFGVRNVKVYWNGIPFTDANGNTYLNQIAFHHIGSMEILKGPSGSRYGAGTGGVVLLQTEKIQDTGWGIRAHTAGGSYGMFSAGIRMAFKGDGAQHVLAYSHQQSDGYRNHSRLMRRVADYSGSYKISSKQHLHTHFFYSNLYYQTPGGLTQQEVTDNPRNARPGAESQQAALFLKTLYAGLAHEAQLSNRWSATTSVYASNTRFKNPTIRNYERKTEQGAGGRLEVTYKSNAWKVAAGGEFQHSFTNAGVYANAGGVRDTLQSQDEISSTLYNMFLQGDWSVEKWNFTAGVSYNSGTYRFLRANIPGFQQQYREFKPDLIPRIAIHRSAGKYANLYASVSKGFSPPSIDEVYASDAIFNRTLNAEQGTNVELGMKLLPVRNTFWGDVAIYYYRLNETIVSRRDSTGGDFYVNAGTTEQWGVESAWNYVIHQKSGSFLSYVKAWTSITLTHARFVEYQKGQGDFDGNRLTGVPYQVVHTGVDLKTRNGLSAMVSHAYTGRIPLNDAGTFVAPHYNRVFARIDYALPLQGQLKSALYFAWEKSFNNPFSLGNDLNAAVNRYFNPTAPWQITGGVVLKYRY